MNLNQFDEAFGGAENTAKETGELPSGKYIAKVIDTEVFESKGGRPIFKIVLEVVDGEYKGAKVTKIHGLDNPERFKYLKGDLTTCGLFLTKISELPAKHEKIRGITLNMTAKQNGEYVNYYLNSQVRSGEAVSNNTTPF